MVKTLSSMNVATAFASFDNVVILDGVGGKNTETEAATTYSVFVPERCLPYLSELRTWTNNNWEGKAMVNMTTAEKLSYVAKLAETFEPSMPMAQTPLKLAVQNILVRNPNNAVRVQGLTGAALIKAVAPDVEAFLQRASLEKYRSQIEAEIALIAASTSKRSRRDGTAKPSDSGVGMSFDTDDDGEEAA